ncbi:MAG TPA: bacteriohemerythrin [bacterium]|nr:bacteriohemerythrin [bacterium]
MQTKKMQIVIVIVSIFLFGTLGYYFIEDGWTLFDAFYMVAITITTVGFGEIHDLSPAGRIFTTFLIFTGLGAAATFATYFARFIIEGELKGIFGRKKMQNKIKNIQGHYIVCGHGENGITICLNLYENEIPFVVIDSDAEALEIAEQRGYLTVKGDAASDMALLAAGIERASGIVTCIPNDASTISISLAARELNNKIHIIAQGNDPTIETRMFRAGVDTVVYPLKLGGEQIARLIAKHYGIAPADRRQHEDVKIPEHDPGVMGYYIRIFRLFDDKKITIREAIAKTNSLFAVALKTGDGEILENPSQDTEITRNDSLVMLVQKTKSILQTDVSQKETGITWSDKLSIGITAIDEEHRNLVLLLNRFQKSVSAGSGREKIVSVFEKLLDYTVTHFKNEEEFMQKYDYPETDNQVQEHRALTKTVMELNKDKRYVFQENICEFLNSWLKEHIMGTDKKLGEFLNKQGVK